MTDDRIAMKCVVCDSPMPYGDERHVWIEAHRHRVRRFLRRRFG